MPKLRIRIRNHMPFCCGTLAVLSAVTAVVLLFLSRSNPWFAGLQREPYFSWAIGSGRLKVWVAVPGSFSPYVWWTNSWYRGLDGWPIRWDFTLHLGEIIVVAIPL